MSLSIDQLHKAFVQYQDAIEKIEEKFQELSEAAEESGSYYEYDDAKPELLESMVCEGHQLAAVVEKFLNRKIPE